MTRANNNRTESGSEARSKQVIVDCAGAIKGGAARFLRELQSYLRATNPANVTLIGLGEQLSPRWLLKRELLAATADRRIALNNASFLNPKGENITLLRNILQFATRADLNALSYIPPRRLRAQTPVVRSLAKLSDSLIVPCTRMAEKVQAVSPSLKEQLVVRFHPVSQPDWAGSRPINSRDILMPIVPSPYKNLETHVAEFLAASEKLFDEPVRLIVPSTAEAMPEFGTHQRMVFIGPQTSEELDRWWEGSGAVFFPPEFESFGYPLAEARVYGRYVIAQDTSQNHEIAGDALRPYRRSTTHSLSSAIRSALVDQPTPDPEPFNPNAYFKELLLHDRSTWVD